MTLRDPSRPLISAPLMPRHELVKRLSNGEERDPWFWRFFWRHWCGILGYYFGATRSLKLTLTRLREKASRGEPATLTPAERQDIITEVGDYAVDRVGHIYLTWKIKRINKRLR